MVGHRIGSPTEWGRWYGRGLAVTPQPQSAVGTRGDARAGRPQAGSSPSAERGSSRTLLSLTLLLLIQARQTQTP